MNKKSEKWLDIWCPFTGETTDISPLTAARITGRPLRTVRQWAEHGRIPATEMRVLRAAVLGMIGDDQAWGKFRLRGGVLVSLDSGETWTPEQLHCAYIDRQMVRHQRDSIEDLKARLAAVTTALSSTHHHTRPTPWQRRAPRQEEAPAVQLTLPAIPAHPWHARQKKARY